MSLDPVRPFTTSRRAPLPHRDGSPLDAAMDRYVCGDARAFAEVHRALYPRLLAYFLRRTRSRLVADDLAQETWLRVHRGRSSFAPGAAALPWVYTIARNVHRDHARTARLQVATVGPEEPADPVDRGGADAEAEAIVAEATGVVERVLSRIPSTQREAFVLLRFEGLRVEEAAAALGTTVSAVKLRAFRAYEALRAELDVCRPGRAASC